MFKVKMNSRSIAYMALFVALQVVLEFVFKIIPGQPQGGSITLSLLPIFLAAYLMGPGYGLIVGVVSAAIQFVLGIALYYGPWSVMLDYVVPLSIIAVAPLFKSIPFGNGKEFHIGIIIGMILKYISHVLSGALLFGMYAPEGMNPWVYSLGYNAFYNIGTCIVTLVVFTMIYPRLKNAIKFQK